MCVVWEGAAEWYRDTSHHAELCKCLGNWFSTAGKDAFTVQTRERGPRQPVPYRRSRLRNRRRFPSEVCRESLKFQRRSGRASDLGREYSKSRSPDEAKDKMPPLLSSENWGGQEASATEIRRLYAPRGPHPSKKWSKRTGSSTGPIFILTSGRKLQSASSRFF